MLKHCYLPVLKVVGTAKQVSRELRLLSVTIIINHFSRINNNTTVKMFVIFITIHAIIDLEVPVLSVWDKGCR